jgi:Tol biopolymer transport system component
MLGVASPSQLMADPARTPFNVGRRIELTDFRAAEATPLAAGLGRDRRLAESLLERILYWTGAHPYLTQRLCQAVALDDRVAVDDDVDRWCHDLFLASAAQERDDNLIFVREHLLAGEAARPALLDVYASVLRDGHVRDEPDEPAFNALRLSGLVTSRDGLLRVRNRIYGHVFDRAWVSNHLPAVDKGRSSGAARPSRSLLSGALSNRIRWNHAGIALVCSASLMLIAAGAPWMLGRHGDASVPAQTLPLTSDPGFEEFPALSPDGNQVAYVGTPAFGAESALFVKTIGADGPTSIRRLASRPGSAPVWSPDGGTIAFARPAGADSGIYVVPTDGNTPPRRILAASWGHTNYARLSWWGRLLAFTQQDGPDAPHHISILSLEHGTVTRLTTPAPSPSKAVGDFWPVFSPDGRMLAYIHSERFLKEDLYVIRLDGAAPRLIASGQSRIMGLTWTADGQEIVYSSTRSGGFRVSLWRIALAGGPPVPVHDADANALDPSVSRQGGRLVYTHAYFDTNIWRFPVSNGTAGPGIRLIHSTMSEYSASYSPDGRRIAFESARSGEQEIWICNADGSGVKQLTFRHVSPTGSPRWSPDGSRIAFDSRHGDNDQIWVISSNGGEPRQLTDGSFQNESPSWSRDGTWIYYTSRRSGTAQIWRVPAEGGTPVQITAQGGGPAVESVDGQSLLYSRENAAGIWSVPVSGGREVQVYDFPDRPAPGKWSMTATGIYFARRENDRWLFFRADFSTQAISPVAAVASGRLWGQVDVSPDDAWLLATVTDEGTADLRLIEGFR